MTRQATQQTIAEQEIAFREANEKIEATADSVSLLGLIPFVCECPRSDCVDIVRLTFDEYEAVRQHPRRFFNVPGHEADSVAAGAEAILVVFEHFTIVEKVGIAGEMATDAHGAASSEGI